MQNPKSKIKYDSTPKPHHKPKLAHPLPNLDFNLERDRPMEMRPEQPTTLVYRHPDSKYSRAFANYLYGVVPEKTELIHISYSNVLRLRYQILNMKY